MSNGNYVFYSVFVENEKSNRYICELPGAYVVRSHTSVECRRTFGLIPYEQVLNYVDPVNTIITKAVIVVQEGTTPGVYNGYMIESGTKVCLQEIAGHFIHVLKSEGEEVKAGESIAYIVTGKLEVRNVTSPCSGRLALIVDITWETPRRTILVIPDELREIAVRKNS